jgi:hypothetical protein
MGVMNRSLRGTVNGSFDRNIESLFEKSNGAEI